MNTIFNQSQLFSFLQPDDLLKRRSGRGQRGILVILQNAEEGDPVDPSFLPKILQAIKLEQEQDTWSLPIVATEQISFNHVPDRSVLKTVLVFGASPKQLGLQFQIPHYQARKISDLEFLFAPELSVISNSQEDKKKLWRALQALFLQS
ncbi:MAG: hypothetical protein AAGH79_13260 [Bacteroidota bacterium]